MTTVARRLTLTLAAILASVLLPAAGAAAADLCVGQDLGCDVAHTWTFNEAGLQAALSTAGSNGTGGDTLKIAAGEIGVGSELYYGPDPGDPVQIVGQGIGQTILRPTAHGLTLLELDLDDAPSSTLSGITFAAFAGTDSGYPQALDMSAGTASSIAVYDAPNSPTSGDINTGVRLSGGARLETSAIHLSGSVT